jgi:uncharacterized membrane protein YgcG
VRVLRDFPRWRIADAAQVAFYIVREGRARALAAEEDPDSAAGILVATNKLASDDLVVAGSWLLARITPDGASCAPHVQSCARTLTLNLHSLTPRSQERERGRGGGSGGGVGASVGGGGRR